VLVDIRTLASELAISRSTAYRLTEQNVIPHYRIGGQLRFDLIEVSEAIRSNGNGHRKRNKKAVPA
jgi:excisionase family DNA binding protein